MSLLLGNAHFGVLAAKVVSRVGIRVISLLVVISGTACLLLAQPAVNVDVYPTDQAGRIAVGPDGALWFTESVAGKIGRITTSGVITEYAIPTASGYPYGIVAGPDGALWFTELQAQKVGRITTAGSVTEYPVSGNPSPNITAGPDGAL